MVERQTRLWPFLYIISRSRDCPWGSWQSACCGLRYLAPALSKWCCLLPPHCCCSSYTSLPPRAPSLSPLAWTMKVLLRCSAVWVESVPVCFAIMCADFCNVVIAVQADLLTRAGKKILVQFVLTSMLIYLMMAMDLPAWALKAIDKIRRAFLWRGRKWEEGIAYCLAHSYKASRARGSWHF